MINRIEMNIKNILRPTILIILTIILSSCKPQTNPICMYGIDSLTNGAGGKSFRKFFDEEYKTFYASSEPGYIHIDYATSKDLNIGYRKSAGLKNMASEDDYSIDPVKYSISGRGIYGFNLTNESFTYNTKHKPFTKVRIYYLQRPDGGSFRYRFLNNQKEYSILQSMKGVLAIKYIELDKLSKNDSIINVFEINGNAAFYGAWYLNGKDRKSVASVINIAKGGMTLNKILTLDSSFRQYWYSQFKPKLVLFNAGTNDRLKINGKTFKNLLDSYIDDILIASPKTNFIIVEPNQTGDYKTSYAKDYTIVREKITKERNLSLLDIPKLIGNYDFFIDNNLMLDGVHPNEEGFKLISKVTLDYLKANN